MDNKEQEERAMKELLRELPELPGEPLFDEGTGETYYRGFNGNFSQTPLYVTDGHLLLLASAIDPEFKIERDDESYGRKYATEEAIQKVWNAAIERKHVHAEFIGMENCCAGADMHSPHMELAFVRDARGRVMVVNAYLLAFCVAAVRPDALTVSGEPAFRYAFDAPLALWRSGELVGLLMPMKLRAEDFAQYDMHGKPVSLAQLGVTR